MRYITAEINNTRYFTAETPAIKKLAFALTVAMTLCACSTTDKIDTQVQPVATTDIETPVEPVTDTDPVTEIDTEQVTASDEQELPDTTEIANFDTVNEPVQQPEPEQETLNITLATLRAERGDLESQVALGMAYAKGTPRVEKDPVQAKLWFELAALKGDSRAQYQLGNVFYTGQGADKDYYNAREWWMESALQGNLDAQQKLGYLYSEGLGVQRDFEKARLWYTKAAKEGHAEAQTLLGSLYHEGDRIPTDYSEAFKWYKLAAEQGHPHAQYTLATLYHDGRGTKVDYIQCAAWVDVAIANGFDDEYSTEARCRGQLDELSNRTATHLADVWKQNYMSPGI